MNAYATPYQPAASRPTRAGAALDMMDDCSFHPPYIPHSHVHFQHHSQQQNTLHSHHQQCQRQCLQATTNTQSDGNMKCTIPCFSMTATGTCMIGEHCCFIHEPRAMIYNPRIYTVMWQHLQHHYFAQQKKEREHDEKCKSLVVMAEGETDAESTNSDGSKDQKKKGKEAGFFFPRQLYRGPEADGNVLHYDMSHLLMKNQDGIVVQSLWTHYLSGFSSSGGIDSTVYNDSSYPINLVTRRPRLPVFQFLSDGKPLL